jgi:hypothetical protein
VGQHPTTTTEVVEEEETTTISEGDVAAIMAITTTTKIKITPKRNHAPKDSSANTCIQRMDAIMSTFMMRL